MSWNLSCCVKFSFIQNIFKYDTCVRQNAQSNTDWVECCFKFIHTLHFKYPSDIFHTSEKNNCAITHIFVYLKHILVYHICSVDDLHIYLKNVTLPRVFFERFASKNQLPGSSISGTLVENG